MVGPGDRGGKGKGRVEWVSSGSALFCGCVCVCLCVSPGTVREGIVLSLSFSLSLSVSQEGSPPGNLGWTPILKSSSLYRSNKPSLSLSCDTQGRREVNQSGRYSRARCSSSTYMYVCIRMCMYVCMHVCLYIYTHICIYYI
jgi:hypothetical protein